MNTYEFKITMKVFINSSLVYRYEIYKLIN